MRIHNFLPVALASSCLAAPYEQNCEDIVVKSGQSIQSAIDDAKSGSKIIVEQGTYREQLTITKDGITLFGQNATLLPPSTFVNNTCTGLAGGNTNAGICISGTDIQLDPFVQEHRNATFVGRRVKDVAVSGFTVQGFDGLSIAVIGGEESLVKENKLVNGGSYGVLSHASLGTTVSKNEVVSEDTLRFIGICTDDPSPSQVEYNSVAGYGIGLCVQTNGAQYIGNKVSNACAGVFVDPGIGANIFFNLVTANNPDCLTTFGFVTGILVFGGQDSRLHRNVVRDQKAGGQAAGISVVDALSLSPAVIASDNVVTYNVLVDNDFDLFVNTTGSDNNVRPNGCSTPLSLCESFAPI